MFRRRSGIHPAVLVLGSVCINRGFFSRNPQKIDRHVREWHERTAKKEGTAIRR
nr:hypothetical protein [Bacillus licheniformis]